MTRDELRLELLKLTFRGSATSATAIAEVKAIEAELFPDKPDAVPEERQTLSLAKKSR
jgi:hypothetical protein